MRILGLDEAGRGSVLGPMVIGAFSCLAADEAALQAAGAADSKTLSAKARERIRERLTPLGVAAAHVDLGFDCIPGISDFLLILTY